MMLHRAMCDWVENDEVAEVGEAWEAHFFVQTDLLPIGEDLACLRRGLARVGFDDPPSSVENWVMNSFGGRRYYYPAGVDYVPKHFTLISVHWYVGWDVSVTAHWSVDGCEFLVSLKLRSSLSLIAKETAAAVMARLLTERVRVGRRPRALEAGRVVTAKLRVGERPQWWRRRRRIVAEFVRELWEEGTDAPSQSGGE